jgi:glycosyltransferase involved in cell wall biosynthesis
MLTVLMATYNGASTLPEVLDAYCKLDSPDGGWKLVVVDNGSTDSTKEVITSFRSRLPLTYIFEPILGKSAALNTGLLSITGDLVVMTDDDALPRPDWLVQMRLAADCQPSFSIFGGAIVPHWEIPPEDWILAWCSRLSITDPALEEGPIPATLAYGPNMAVRSEIIKAGYTFDNSLCPVGPRYRMGEDTDFAQTLSKAGFRAWHCKRGVVAHMIQRNQMTREWVLRRAVPSGRSDYRQEFRDDPNSPPLLLGIPRYMIREILTQVLRFGRARLSQDAGADTIFRERWQLHYLLGRAIEGRILHKTCSVACSPISRKAGP